MAWRNIMANKREQRPHQIYSISSICFRLHIHICRCPLRNLPAIRKRDSQSFVQQKMRVKFYTHLSTPCSLCLVFGKQFLSRWIVNWGTGNILRWHLRFDNRNIFVCRQCSVHLFARYIWLEIFSTIFLRKEMGNFDFGYDFAFRNSIKFTSSNVANNCPRCFGGAPST